MSTDATAIALDRLLKTSTGRHMLDSGGAYGRHWERNQSREFASEPESSLHFDVWGEEGSRYTYIEITHNLYHWLADRLTYEPELTRAMEYSVAKLKAREGELDYRKGPDGEWGYFPFTRENVYVTAMDAQAWATELGAHGLYGDGDPFTENTYNGDDMLSQVLQYCYFTIDTYEIAHSFRPEDGVLPELPGMSLKGDEEQGYTPMLSQGASYPRYELEDGVYLALQIHNGCDVRGGYTSAEVFSLEDETAIFDNARAFITCTRPSFSTVQLDGTEYWHNAHRWYSESSHFESDDGTAGLDDYDVVTGSDVLLEDSVNGTVYYDKENAHVHDKLFVDDNGDGYCPRCGHKLEAFA